MILARRHYVSVSLLDFYRQVKLNLFHHYLLKILRLSFCCCLAFVCMHWSLTFSNNTLEKDDIRVTKLAHNGSFADKVLAVLTKSTSLWKIDKEITSILKWPGKIQSYISLSSVFSFFRHSVSVVRLTVGRWVRQSVGQSLSLRVKISSHGQSLSQDFFCLQEMESKKKGCFITK